MLVLLQLLGCKWDVTKENSIDSYFLVLLVVLQVVFDSKL
jgi:hypothetical protein